MNESDYITGSRAVEIEASVEASIRDGRLAGGAQLPPVRGLAVALGVSPATVASAYRALRERGLVRTRGRLGTSVSLQPPLPPPLARPLPEHVRDLAAGNPDPALLPELGPALRELAPIQRLYGEDLALPELLRIERRRFRRDRIDAAHLTIVSGAIDGIERALLSQLRPGDRVGVEDPAFSGVLALLQALGMVAVPIAIDDRGLLPDALEKRLVQGIDALIVTPRAQNPTGAALDPLRATQLRALLAPYADLLVIEDDHAGPVSGVPAQTLCIERSRFAVVRSHSKALGPDLRVASLAGDAETVARIEGRQLIGIRWVSHVLQGLVAALLSQQGTPSLLRRAASRYRQRREALLAQLASRGVEAHGRSGLNVWIPVPEEAAAVSALLERGWAVSAGERFRLGAGSAIRVTTATLLPRESALLARDLADQLSPVARTYSA